MLKFISNETNENEYPSEATEICDDKIKNKKRTIKKTTQAYYSEKDAENFS